MSSDESYDFYSFAVISLNKSAFATLRRMNFEFQAANVTEVSTEFSLTNLVTDVLKTVSRIYLRLSGRNFQRETLQTIDDKYK